MATCEGCGANIVWAVTHRGKRQPFDREPGPKGNRVLLGRGSATPPLAVPVEWVNPPEEWTTRIGEEVARATLAALSETLYTPHHATCPKADDFRG